MCAHWTQKDKTEGKKYKAGYKLAADHKIVFFFLFVGGFLHQTKPITHTHTRTRTRTRTHTHTPRPLFSKRPPQGDCSSVRAG